MLSKVVGDPASGDLVEPVLEPAFGGVVAEVGHLTGHGHDGFLDHVLGFGVLQAGFAGDVIDEAPIGFEKITP